MYIMLHAASLRAPISAAWGHVGGFKEWSSHNAISYIKSYTPLALHNIMLSQYMVDSRRGRALPFIQQNDTPELILCHKES